MLLSHTNYFILLYDLIFLSSITIRVTTKTPSIFSSRGATNARTSGKNVWKIMDFSAVRPFKQHPDAKHVFYHGAAHSGKIKISLLQCPLLRLQQISNSFLQIQWQNAKTNHRICSRQLCEAADISKVTIKKLIT